jgi:hypothetical protein
MRMPKVGCERGQPGPNFSVTEGPIYLDTASGSTTTTSAIGPTTRTSVLGPAIALDRLSRPLGHRQSADVVLGYPSTAYPEVGEDLGREIDGMHARKWCASREKTSMSFCFMLLEDPVIRTDFMQRIPRWHGKHAHVGHPIRIAVLNQKLSKRIIKPMIALLTAL